MSGIVCVKEVDLIVDGLGRPVDGGIRDAVVALRLLGLDTSGSCEGHLDHGMRAPWVDFEVELSDEMRRRHQAAVDRGDSDEVQRIENEAIALASKEWNKLLPLLDEFYRGRDVSYDRRLVLIPMNAATRLMSQGAQLQRGEVPGIVYGRLKSYREEMDAFMRFAREKMLRAV
jgi:hypothetical protein